MGNLLSFIGSSGVTRGKSHKTGIIRRISKDLCVVSVNIDGSAQSLYFEKTAFYCWGHPCEGDMTNLLDVGMEVNVRFRIPESQKPTVVAAWIGVEPKVVNEPLVAVFNQEGFVDEVVDDEAVLIFGESIGNCVIAKKGVVYRDGSLLDESSSPLSLDEPIVFDAFPLEVEHPSGAMYEATCAWIGPEPRLVDRFRLRGLESDPQRMFAAEMNRVRGTVVVIPNDVVALAEIEDTKEKILVFRSSFGQGFESIHDAVGVGDRLSMHLASACMLGRKQLFATKACEIGKGIEASLDVDSPPPTVPSLTEPKSATKSAGGGARLTSTNSLEERDRGIFKDVNGSTFEDRTVSMSGPSAEKPDSRVVTNGLSAEHGFRSMVANSSSGEEPVDTNGSSVEIQDRRADTSGLSPKKRDGRLDSSRSSTEERDGEADTNDSSSEERNRRPQTNGSLVVGRDNTPDTNGASTKDQAEILQTNVTPVEEPVRRADTNGLSSVTRDKGSSGRLETGLTNGLLSPETGDLKEPPVSYDLNGTALYREPPLSGVIYTKPTLKDEAVISYEGRCIYVNLCDVYVNGRPCTKKQFSALVKPANKTVNFEAVSYESSTGKMNFSHYATCVWVGEKPSVAVVASSIWDIDDSILRFGGRTYVGKVENFCFPDIALLSIEAGKDTLLSVVCLHLSELERKAKHSGGCSGPVRKCISDFVTFQGYIEFKVKRDDACPLGLCAYDVKKSTTLAVTKSSELCANLLQELKCTSSGSSKKCPESESQCAPVSQESESVSLEVIKTASSFIPSISVAKRSFFLNGIGTFCFDEKTQVAKIEHMFGSSLLDSAKFRTFRDPGGLKCRFDAEFVQNSATNKLCIKKVWKFDSSKSSSDSILAPELAQTKLTSFDDSQMYRFVIVSIPFHDCAIAESGGIKVYVPLYSIITSPKADPNLCSLELFLSVGDHVGLKLKEEKTMHTGTFLSATACYKLAAETAVIPANNQLSWRNVWELGEFFKTGRVTEKKGAFFVDFVSTKLPETKVSLDLSKVYDCGRLFVDGKPLSESMSCLAGRDISIHVACRPFGSTVASCVEWAWVGNYPLLSTLLKNRTAASHGLICPDWFYEGIVREFPLPTYAICQVGFLSVLLPLTAEKKDGDIVGVVESHLKEGDRVILSVKEQFCVKQAILISSLCRSALIMFEESEVLINVRGKVTALPRPKGTIKVQGLPHNVWFDRSVVLAVNGISRKEGDVFQWIELIDASISIGTQVYFSAAKDLTWNKWYRVYEMRVENAHPK